MMGWAEATDVPQLSRGLRIYRVSGEFTTWSLRTPHQKKNTVTKSPCNKPDSTTHSHIHRDHICSTNTVLFCNVTEKWFPVCLSTLCAVLLVLLVSGFFTVGDAVWFGFTGTALFLAIAFCWCVLYSLLCFLGVAGLTLPSTCNTKE